VYLQVTGWSGCQLKHVVEVTSYFSFWWLVTSTSQVTDWYHIIHCWIRRFDFVSWAVYGFKPCIISACRRQFDVWMGLKANVKKTVPLLCLVCGKPWIWWGAAARLTKQKGRKGQNKKMNTKKKKERTCIVLKYSYICT
jgi:hypothetical protein